MRVEWLGRVDFEDALALQQRLVEARLSGSEEDIVLLLEHPPVFTIGRGLDRSSLRGVSHLTHPLVTIQRGGQATYHGPGQLIGYPILNLKKLRPDLHWYVRALEGILIEVLRQYGVKASRVEGLTGVWVGPRKIASIGVGVRRWVTMHGFALNVCGDLSPFQQIVPCGIAGAEMTSIEQETGSPLPPEQLCPALERLLAQTFDNTA